MGVFGYGPLDNDDAADVIEMWEEFGENLKPKERVIKIFEEVLTNDLKLLALGQICISNGVRITGKLKKSISQAIVNQLEIASEWEDPKQRLNSLREFQDELGIKELIRGHGPQDKISLRRKKFQEFENTEELFKFLRTYLSLCEKYGHYSVVHAGYTNTDIYNIMTQEDIQLISGRMPKIFSSILKILNQDISEEEYEVHEYLKMERSTLLAVFGFSLLHFSKLYDQSDQILDVIYEEIVDRIKKLDS